MSTTSHFYDTLASYYHLIFPDWAASMKRQGAALDEVLREQSHRPVRTILDAACGIGTQSLPLAALGYDVTGSDISTSAVERAGREAEARRLAVSFRTADMRELSEHPESSFDAVIACDNSVPHLLSDADILQAFKEFYRLVAPGGLCVVSVRDYETLERGGVQVHPYGLREENGVRFVLLQVWEWSGGASATHYDTTMYVIEHAAEGRPQVYSSRGTYYAVSIPTLIDLMKQAGFEGVERRDEVFYQPILVCHRPAT